MSGAQPSFAQQPAVCTELHQGAPPCDSATPDTSRQPECDHPAAVGCGRCSCGVPAPVSDLCAHHAIAAHVHLWCVCSRWRCMRLTRGRLVEQGEAHVLRVCVATKSNSKRQQQWVGNNDSHAGDTHTHSRSTNTRAQQTTPQPPGHAPHRPRRAPPSSPPLRAQRRRRRRRPPPRRRRRRRRRHRPRGWPAVSRGLRVRLVCVLCVCRARSVGWPGAAMRACVCVCGVCAGTLPNRGTPHTRTHATHTQRARNTPAAMSSLMSLPSSSFSRRCTSAASASMPTGVVHVRACLRFS
jgi:hypothetical protein